MQTSEQNKWALGLIGVGDAEVGMKHWPYRNNGSYSQVCRKQYGN